MKHSSIFKVLGGVIGITLAGISATAAQSVEEFYRNNTVTLVVGAAGGGGADTYARGFAPFLQKHLPGNPQVVITNLPGASGMAAAIQMQSSAPRDGTMITFLQRNNLFLPLVSEVEIPFDPVEVNWVGSLNKELYGVLVRSGAGVTTAADLFTTPIKMSATSFANENRVLPAMMNKYFGTKFEIVPGYDGSPAMSLALERGEVDGRMVSIDFLMSVGPERPMIADGRMSIVMLAGMTGSTHFPDAPNILDFTTDPAVTAVAEFLMLPMEAGQPFAAPPGVPEDRLAALRKAFMDAATDPIYVKQMSEGGNTPSPISGEAVEEVVARLYAAPQSTLDEVKSLINPPR